MNKQHSHTFLRINVSDIKAEILDSQSFNIFIQNVNDAPIINSTPILIATEEVLYVYDVDASDDDLLNPTGTSLSFATEI